MTTDKHSHAMYLADELEKLVPFSLRRDLEPTLQAASELRRLHALNHELLEALQDVVPMLEHMLMIRGEPQPGSIGHKARAALAKATGE